MYPTKNLDNSISQQQQLITAKQPFKNKKLLDREFKRSFIYRLLWHYEDYIKERGVGIQLKIKSLESENEIELWTTKESDLSKDHQIVENKTLLSYINNNPYRENKKLRVIFCLDHIKFKFNFFVWLYMSKAARSLVKKMTYNYDKWEIEFLKFMDQFIVQNTIKLDGWELFTKRYVLFVLDTRFILSPIC